MSDQVQPRPGHLHSVSSNPASAGADFVDPIAGDGTHVTSDTYPHTVSANKQSAGSGSPEGQTVRGYPLNQKSAAPSVKDTSAGRVRSL